MSGQAPSGCYVGVWIREEGAEVRCCVPAFIIDHVTADRAMMKEVV